MEEPSNLHMWHVNTFDVQVGTPTHGTREDIALPTNGPGGLGYTTVQATSPYLRLTWLFLTSLLG